MVRNNEDYIKAIKLRKDGLSIKRIAKEVGISSSTASIWCRHIELTVEQKEKLKNNPLRNIHLKNLARQRHEEKVIRDKALLIQGKSEIGDLNNREFFLLGLALYWAEGFKTLKEGRVGFCNSDPEMIKLIISWFKQYLDAKSEDFILRTEFNEAHRDRTEEIESHWESVTGIPRIQFNKPFYQKSLWKRNYSNKSKYYGVLRIRIRKSSQRLVKLKGWIEGLHLSV